MAIGALLAVLVPVLVPASGLTWARTPLVVRAYWRELPSLIEGRRVKAVLTDGTHIEGMVLGAGDAGIHLRVTRSSEIKRWARGVHEVPRDRWTTLRVIRYKGPARAILTTLTASGALAASAAIFSKVASDGAPIVASLTGISALLGYGLGKTMDDESFVVEVIDSARSGGQSPPSDADVLSFPVPAGKVGRVYPGEQGELPDETRAMAHSDLEATQRVAFAGPDGMVEFRGLPPGKVMVVASRPGARTARLEAELVSGQAVSLSVIVP